MPAPLAALGSFVFGAGSSATGSMFNAPTRELTYVSNMAYPSALPGPETILAAWQRGYLDDLQTRICLGCHGVQLPAVGELNHLLGDIADQGVQVSPAYGLVWTAAGKLQQSIVSPEEVLTLLNRERITLAQASEFLRRGGMIDQGQQTAFLSLRYQLPTPSDLISFAVKEAWDPVIVGRYGYDEEFPREFAYWMERQGFGGDSRMPDQIAAGGNLVSWARQYWRVHWTNISPTQAYEMFHRLRPDRMHIYRETLPDVQPFLLQDVQAILKINDYPPAFRDQLTAIAYNKPRLVDIQRFYKLGIIDENEVQQLHLDYGYPPALATMRTSFVIQTAQTEELAKLKVNPIASLLKSYGQGVLTRDQLAEKIYAWAVAGTEAGREFAELPAAQRQAIARASGRVVAIIDKFDLDEANKANERYLKSLRRQYTRGIVSRLTARLNMVQRGFGDAFINRTLNEWDQDLQSGRLMLSTAQIRRLVIKQILPVNVADAWLENLGWAQPERQAILAEMNRDLRMEFAKAQEAAARTQKQKQAAIERQLKAAQAEADKQKRKLLATATPAKAHRWFVRGYFTEADLTKVLTDYEFPPKNKEAALKEARDDRREYLAKKQEEQEEQEEGEGQA